MRKICFALLAVLLVCQSARAERGQADLTAWLPELPPDPYFVPDNRPHHLHKWLHRIRPGMSVATVVVMLGAPDWGVDRRGKIRWWIEPKKGVLQYTMRSHRDWKGSGDRVVRLYFDPWARVKTIVDNGVVIAKAPPNWFQRPVSKNVPWRRAN